MLQSLISSESTSLLGPESPWLWGGFIILVLLLLALDLGVFHRKAHVISSKEALGWSTFWIALALVFGGFVFWILGPQQGIDFLTGYLIEKSLSVDNLFVIAMIFTGFGVPREYQHRVLFWGIVGALVMRGVLIIAGVALIHRFEFVTYFFGAFLLFTGFRMLLAGDKPPQPEHNLALRFFKKVVPTTSRYDGQHLFTIENGKKVATPLLAALVVVEAMDLVFAVDSIPAVFAVTLDPFIVFTSNVFAILGLRSLYFLLADALERFVHLKIGLAIILVYVGVKMLLAHTRFQIPSLISLAVVLAILAISILTSLVVTREKKTNGAEG